MAQLKVMKFCFLRQSEGSPRVFDHTWALRTEFPNTTFLHILLSMTAKFNYPSNENNTTYPFVHVQCVVMYHQKPGIRLIGTCKQIINSHWTAILYCCMITFNQA